MNTITPGGVNPQIVGVHLRVNDNDDIRDRQRLASTMGVCSGDRAERNGRNPEDCLRKKMSEGVQGAGEGSGWHQSGSPGKPEKCFGKSTEIHLRNRIRTGMNNSPQGGKRIPRLHETDCFCKEQENSGGCPVSEPDDENQKDHCINPPLPEEKMKNLFSNTPATTATTVAAVGMGNFPDRKVPHRFFIGQNRIIMPLISQNLFKHQKQYKGISF